MNDSPASIGAECEEQMTEETALGIWAALGLISHVFWWAMMGMLKDPLGVFLFALTLPCAALVGPIVFPFEAWLCWLTGPHD